MLLIFFKLKKYNLFTFPAIYLNSIEFAGHLMGEVVYHLPRTKININYNNKLIYRKIQPYQKKNVIFYRRHEQLFLCSRE